MKLLDRFRESVVKTLRVPEGQSAPVAILWTDATGEWLPLAPILRVLIPEFFTIGAYRPEERMGPAIWLKCIVDRTVPEAPLPGTTPLLYLPNVSRQVLRAAMECPAQWAPLIELQYRGRVWHQSNGRDWTVMAFLVSAEGLALDVAQDRRTEEALGRALPLLADIDLSPLARRRLDADDFDRLSVADPVRDLLQWLNAPERFEQTQAGRWVAFRNRCESEFLIDPADGPDVAIRALAEGHQALEPVWFRFCESPAAYPGFAKLLRAPDTLAIDASRNPAINESEEAKLKNALKGVAGLDQAAAAAKILALEAQHGPRRTWIWARMGQSPWAMGLEPLITLAKLSKSPIGGATVGAAAAAYSTDGYRCDEAALDALSRFRGTTPEAVIMNGVTRALYEPWLDASARHFQDLVRKVGKLASPPVVGERDVCVLFVDGLRFDVGAALAGELEQRGLIVKLGFRLSTLPTVTATAKPAVMKILAELHGASGDDFTPFLGIKPATAPVLRDAIAQTGVEVLEGAETCFPSGGESGGWAEFGQIDAYGHAHPDDLPARLRTEVMNAADRIMQLLGAGWRKVRVVTDHGWLLMPEGLRKVELPAYLAATKWSRCAVVKGDAAVPSYPWHWNADVRIASPPGIASFRLGEKYAHGGVSLQECVVPEIVVEQGIEAVRASIVSVDWRGMRCRVKVDSNDPAVRVDLRTNWKQAGSTIVAAAKEVGRGGEVNLVVEDDRHEGGAAVVVVIDPGGAVLSQKATSVGEKS
jgi:hypothetical protein